MDASRTALRLGAKEITVVYRRTRAEMPASDEEIEEAIEEGVELDYLTTPTNIESSNGKLKVTFTAMALGKVDESGRPRPVPIDGSEYTGEFDTMIKALGQQPVVPGKYGLSLERNGTITVNADTMATEREGVFAGGDAVSGPASVIEAIAAGRRAAISIDKYLGGEGNIDEALAAPEIDPEPANPDEMEAGKYRPEMPLSPCQERIKNFAQVVLGYSPDMAIEEAKRCLRCDLEGL